MIRSSKHRAKDKLANSNNFNIEESIPLQGSSCTRNVACVHFTFMVVTVHAVFEGLHKNFLFCSRTGVCMYKKKIGKCK